MSPSTNIKLFEGRNIRTLWDEKAEKWYFSVVDIIGVLTDSENPRHYWTVLKGRLKAEGNQSVTNCDQLKFQAERFSRKHKSRSHRWRCSWQSA